MGNVTLSISDCLVALSTCFVMASQISLSKISLSLTLTTFL